jgi:PAS domain-containing protein/DNA-binding protein Fis
MPRTRGDTQLYTTLGALDADAAARLLSAASDFALVLDDAGLILSVVAKGDDSVAQQARAWCGRDWAQTVTVDSRQKIEALLRDAQSADAAGLTAGARWRQVNHPIKDGEDLPLLYATVRLATATRANPKGRIVAFGRDLRALVALQRRLVESQQTMERDYWRFREAETRYRHLLETSSEAVLIVDGANQKVLEANPAARALCASVRNKLVGSPLAAVFDAAHAERLQDLLAAARSVGKREPVHTRLADGLREVAVSASVFRQDDAAFVLVRMVPVRDTAANDARDGKKGAGKNSAAARRALGAGAGSNTGAAWETVLASYVQNAPDALVFSDATGKVLTANRAFLALAELSGEDQARGQALDRWLGRTGVELGVLITNLRQRGTVGRFVTSLRGEYGTVIEVEISAAQLNALDSVAGANAPSNGPANTQSTVLSFAIRDIERRPKTETETGRAMTRSVGELAELVGRTPLKDIVAETTDLIEQLCIETALDMSHDNRASAALLLGLSRQSLYVKLRRYGLGSLGADEQ